MAPNPPNVRSAPAAPWRSIDRLGGPDMAPNPPTFAAPRRRRGARLIDLGAPTWPPTPRRSERPGGAVALLCHRLQSQAGAPARCRLAAVVEQLARLHG